MYMELFEDTSIKISQRLYSWFSMYDFFSSVFQLALLGVIFFFTNKSIEKKPKFKFINLSLNINN